MVANFMSDDKRIETHCGRIAESFGPQPALVLAEEGDNLSPSHFVTGRRASPGRS